MDPSLKKDEQKQTEVTWGAILEDLFVRLFAATIFACLFYSLLVLGLRISRSF